MRSEIEVQRAHDLLLGILLEEVPKPYDGPAMGAAISASAHVLCWVLEHDHDKEVSFKQLLELLDGRLKEMGYEFKEKKPDEPRHHQNQN